MKVRVPASSANLGPGFDCFGIAWQLYNEIDFELCEKGIEISGCDRAFCSEKNLAYAAYKAVLELCGIKSGGLRIRFGQTDIPISRGLGSSSALLVGGIMAANALHDLKLSREELLNIATALEGHPDNVAPALFGGLSASALVAGKPVTVHFPLSEKLGFAALVPPYELPTAQARAVLPRYVPREDAIFNVSRAALLLNALGSGDVALLRTAMSDRLHEPYRIPLIEGFDIARGLAYKCGAASICVSGAGSTLLCVSDRYDFVPVVTADLNRALPGWKVISLGVEQEGAYIVE